MSALSEGSDCHTRLAVDVHDLQLRYCRDEEDWHHCQIYQVAAFCSPVQLQRCGVVPWHRWHSHSDALNRHCSVPQMPPWFLDAGAKYHQKNHGEFAVSAWEGMHR